MCSLWLRCAARRVLLLGVCSLFALGSCLVQPPLRAILARWAIHDAPFSVAVGREIVRALEAAVSDYDTYFVMLLELLSIHDTPDNVAARLECVVGVPPAAPGMESSGLLPSMYEQRYRYMRWVYSCTNGVLDLALAVPSVAQYIKEMAPMDAEENHYTDWVFRFLHRLMEEAETSPVGAAVLAEAEAQVILLKFKQFELSTYVPFVRHFALLCLCRV